MNKLLLYILIIFNVNIVFSQIYIEDITHSSIGLKDIVYDSSNDLIYGITEPFGTYSNSVVAINPQNNEVEFNHAFENIPAILAISDNNQYIYIGFQESSVISRFDIASQTFTEFTLGNDEFGEPYLARDIAVQPGNSLTIAVSRSINYYSSDCGIGIYDDGMVLPSITESSSVPSSQIIYFEDEDTLIGYNTYIGTLNIHNVNTMGLTLGTSSQYTPHSTGSVMDFCITDNKKLFFNILKVVDLLPTPTLSDVIEVMPVMIDPAVCYDKSNNLVCYAGQLINFEYANNEWYIIALNRFNPQNNALVDLSYISLPLNGPVEKIIPCGDGRYAIINNLNTKLSIFKHSAYLATNTFQQDNSTILYPNPATHTLEIKSSLNTITKAEVYNSEGKLIIKSDSVDIINVESLSKGVYLIKLIDKDNNIYTEKFVKN